MTDNRTTERVDHPPRVREAIDELMREKDATDNRTTELLPCPFCGSKNVETSYKDTFSGDFRRGVYCADCCGGIYPYYDTEAEAIAAWNSRAERTCECVAEYAKSPIDGKTIVLHRCSACHELMRPYMAYCPNCGAKVVDA